MHTSSLATGAANSTHQWRRAQILDFSATGYAAEIDRSTPRGESGRAPGKALEFAGHDGNLYANGAVFHVKGINW